MYFLGVLVALTGQIMPQHNLFAFLGDELLFLTPKRDFSCCPSGVENIVFNDG